MNIADLKKALDLPDSPEVEEVKPSSRLESSQDRLHRVRRESMEQLSLIKVVAYVILFFFLLRHDISELLYLNIRFFLKVTNLYFYCEKLFE